jgi:hypothetical protein
VKSHLLTVISVCTNEIVFLNDNVKINVYCGCNGVDGTRYCVESCMVTKRIVCVCVVQKNPNAIPFIETKPR